MKPCKRPFFDTRSTLLGAGRDDRVRSIEEGDRRRGDGSEEHNGWIWTFNNIRSFKILTLRQNLIICIYLENINKFELKFDFDLKCFIILRHMRVKFILLLILQLIVLFDIARKDVSKSTVRNHF